MGLFNSERRGGERLLTPTHPGTGGGGVAGDKVVACLLFSLAVSADPDRRRNDRLLGV